MYVFDNSPLSVLFRNYYRGRFPTLWDRFDRLVADGHIVSTREVCREAEDSSLENLRDWAAQQHAVFHIPTAAEGTFVAGIYAVPHFQQRSEEPTSELQSQISNSYAVFCLKHNTIRKIDT